MRLVPAALAAALLLWPGESGQSAGPALGSLPLEGPFPVEQRVSLSVPSVQFYGRGDQTGSGEPRLHFGLALWSCNRWRQPESGQWIDVNYARNRDPNIGLTSILSPRFDDCDETWHGKEIRAYSGIDSGDVRNVDVRLPEDGQGIAVSRYQGNFVRVAIAGGERDVFADDFMGSAAGEFTFRSNYGAGGDPFQDWLGEYSVNTCNPDVVGPLCFETTFRLIVVPTNFTTSVGTTTAPDLPGRRLRVSEVYGPDQCLAGQPAGWGVSLANPEPVASEDYLAVIALLDPDTHRIIRTWLSAAQPPIGPSGAAAAIPVPDVELPAGQHRLMVTARTTGTNPGYMATAVETTVGCKPAIDDVLVDPPDLRPVTPASDVPRPGLQLEPATPTPTTGVRREPRDLALPTPTPTPDPRRGIDVRSPR